jgi:hypothetical protein
VGARAGGPGGDRPPVRDGLREALPQLEELAAKEAPVEADLRTLRRSVPHGDVALARFFELATPTWFPLLRDAGYFTNPPGLEPDEEGRVAYVPWPPGAYLARLAANERYRAEVAELARALGRTDNPAAREAIVDIALAVPPEDGVVLAEQVTGFLTSPYQLRLPLGAGELAVHFAAGGHIAGAANDEAAIARAAVIDARLAVARDQEPDQ